MNSPDPALRNRALVGVEVLFGLTPGGAGWRGGRAYDPASGRSYDARLKVAGGSRLHPVPVPDSILDTRGTGRLIAWGLPFGIRSARRAQGDCGAPRP